MDIVLSIVKFFGMGVAALIAVVIIAVVGFRIWLNYQMKKILGKNYRALAAFGEEASEGLTPRIQLEVSDQPWKNRRLGKKLKEATSLGFQEVGRYRVVEMPALQLALMIHPLHQFLLVYYDLPLKREPYFDLLLLYADDTRDSVTSSPFYMDFSLEGNRQWPQEEGTISDAMATLLSARRESELIDLEQADLVNIIEEAYAADFDERLHQNYVSATAIRRSTEYLTQQPLQDEMMATLIENQYLELERAIPTVVTEYFCRAKALSKEEWALIEQDVAIIHERESVESLWERYFEPHFYEERYHESRDEMVLYPLVPEEYFARFETARRRFADLPVEYFRRMNQGMPAHLRWEIIGKVQYPLQAILALPPKERAASKEAA